MHGSEAPLAAPLKEPLADCQHVEHTVPVPEPQPWTDQEEAKLVRKVDLFVMPTIWLMYLLSYVDRTNIGNAKVAGMQQDLHMSSSDYSLSLVVFFITYVVFQVPSNLILAKTRPSVYLPVIMLVWGAVTCCMAVVSTTAHLIALRLVVGTLESGFAPGVLLLLSCWYKKEEQSKRFAVYISAAVLSGAFGGLLAGGITSSLEGAYGIRGWRWLFIIEGVATCGWSLVSYLLLLDFPSTTRKFSERERMIATQRLRRQESGVEGDNDAIGVITALRQSLSNWRTWLFTAGYMVIVGSSTLTYFYPTLVEGLGYTSTKAQYMTIPIYIVAFVATVITGYVSDKAPAHRGAIISAWLIVPTICSVVVCVVYNYTARYILLVLMAAGLWATNALALSFTSSSLASMRREVRGVSLAAVNALGNLAQIYGAYLFPSNDKPRYLLGFGVIAGMCALGVIVYCVGHVAVRKWPLR